MKALTTLSLLLAVSGCAMDQADSGDPESLAELDAVGATAQALSGSPVPSRIFVPDNTLDGVIQKVWTANGLVVGANRRTTRGEGRLENHGNATVRGKLTTVTYCSQGTNVVVNDNVSVAPGGSFVREARCSQGEATRMESDFQNIEAPGSNIGYTNTEVAMPNALSIIDTELDGVITPVSMFGASPEGLVVVSANLRTTRAEARLENRSGVTFGYTLRSTVTCAGAPSETYVTPRSNIAPGQNVLISARCREGNATSATTVFRL